MAREEIWDLTVSEAQAWVDIKEMIVVDLALYVIYRLRTLLPSAIMQYSTIKYGKDMGRFFCLVNITRQINVPLSAMPTNQKDILQQPLIFVLP